MLTGNEKRLIVAVLFLIVMGWAVWSLRTRVQVTNLPPEDLPSVEESGHRG